VATSDDNAASGATVEVTIALAEVKGLERFDQTPVSVYIVKERRRNVLAAPVTALLAQSGGGYAVEVVARDGTHRLVPVEVGMFASGYVEVSGVAAGTRVVVPVQ
jgi:multidrug efflux pump subunit AcrA (membrane-fusion protein)